MELLDELAKTHIENHTVAAICLLVGALVFALDFASPREAVTPVLYVIVVLLSLWSPDPRLTWIAAITETVFTILGFFISPASAEVWIAVCNRILELLAIWITAALSLQRKRLMTRALEEQRLRAAVFEQLKILQGMLPICSGCKRIRDDKGAWNQREAYIRDHSEAEFSHELCPECVRRMYPECARSGE